MPGSNLIGRFYGHSPGKQNLSRLAAAPAATIFYPKIFAKNRQIRLVIPKQKARLPEAKKLVIPKQKGTSS